MKAREGDIPEISHAAATMVRSSVGLVPAIVRSAGVSLSRFASFCLVCVSAALLIHSFPPNDTGILVWVALVPLFLALDGRSRATSFLFSWLLGTLFCIGIGSWVAVAVLGFANLDLILPGLALGLYYGLFGLGLAHCRFTTQVPLVMAAPVLWVTMEFVRSQMGMLELPWGLLSHTQYQNLPIIQVASVTGTYGVSCLIVLVNAFLADMLLWLAGRRGPAVSGSTVTRYAVVVGTAVTMTYAYGLFSLSKNTSQEQMVVTVIQGNIPADLKSDPSYRVANTRKHIALSQQANRQQHAGLIAWPELAIQGHLSQDLRLLKEVSQMAKDINSSFVIGTSQRPKASPVRVSGVKKLNSAYLISSQGDLIGRYHKMRLFPFGEYLPYKNDVPWPTRYAAWDDTVPGIDQTLLSIEGVPFASLICWEPIFPDFVRTFVRGGARFIVNISDEAWFGDTQAPYQILSMNVFRAVENGIVIVRAANTGLSVFIDPHGRITGRVTAQGKELFVEGFLTQRVSLLREHTWYTSYGDVFAYGLMGGMVMLMAVPYIQRLRSLRTHRGHP